MLHEEEEFVVHMAGPPLPVRRPRPLKPPLHPTASSISSSKELNKHQHRIGCPHSIRCDNLEFEQGISAPQVITAVSSQVVSVSKIMPSKMPISSSSSTPRALSNLGGKLTSISSTVTPSSRSRSPSPSVSSSTLKSRPATPSYNVESKVKQYIEQVKKFDEEQRSKIALEKKEKFLSLEDLYQVTTPPELKNDHLQMEEKLRETLRIIKEKDEMINKLRESCHDLKLKWADAENRIDEIRFGLGGSYKLDEQERRSSFTLYGSNSKIINKTQPKRSISEMNLHPVNRATNTEHHHHSGLAIAKNVVNKATETDKSDIILLERSNNATSKDKSFRHKGENMHSSSQITTTTDANDELFPDFDLNSGESNFDPVLEEKCSNWLEKVQSWKTDPLQNISADLKDKDSCGDRDSGFRGSAELEQAALKSSKKSPRNSSCALNSYNNPIQSTSKSSSKNQLKSKKAIDTQTIPIPQKTLKEEIPYSIQTIAAHFAQKQAEQLASCVLEGGSSHHNSSSLTTLTDYESTKQLNPASLQIAQPWITFSGNVNPYSATDYEGFPSFYSSSSSQHIEKHFSSYESHRRSASMDRLHTFSKDHAYAHQHGQFSSHCNKHELLSKMDKRFQTLHLLLDSTTDLALRLKPKTENLVKILQETKVPNVSKVCLTSGQDFMSSYKTAPNEQN